MFFSLKQTVKARKMRILISIEKIASFCKARTDYAWKTLLLVRISLLIMTVTKGLRFFSEELFYKSNRKRFFRVCIACTDINTRGIGRILDSYTNLRLRLGFA